MVGWTATHPHPPKARCLMPDPRPETVEAMRDEPATGDWFQDAAMVADRLVSAERERCIAIVEKRLPHRWSDQITLRDEIISDIQGTSPAAMDRVIEERQRFDRFLRGLGHQTIADMYQTLLAGSPSDPPTDRPLVAIYDEWGEHAFDLPDCARPPSESEKTDG